MCVAGDKIAWVAWRDYLDAWLGANAPEDGQPAVLSSRSLPNVRTWIPTGLWSFRPMLIWG